ncbi:MAG: excinuclease ABC subunit UvrC [Balneolales bacterium]
MNKTLQQKLDHLVSNPGVYLFKNAGKEVIYVGKAKRLKTRVRSYFQSAKDHNGKIRAMVRKIADLEIIATDSEAEALILENHLIKKYHPRYNILYRDDKTYPYICVTCEDRPRVFPTRTVIRDGSHYYGPYDHVGKMKVMLETIRKTFHLCTCACSSRMIDRSKGIPRWGKCFEDYFEKCSVELPLEEYQHKMNQVVRLLNGKTQDLIRDLKQEMEHLSEGLAFERAAVVRNGILALEKYSARMKMVASDGLDRDMFALQADWNENIACGVLLQIREGKLLGKYHRYVKNIEGFTESELVRLFMEDYYASDMAGHIPDEVCSSHEPDDEEPLFELLWKNKGRKVPIVSPQRGEKAQLIRMAVSNAKLLLKEWLLEQIKADQGRIPHSVLALGKELMLPQPPRRIECFDISNFQGTHPVASMVCFVDGRPRKSEYKRFHIKTVTGPDDFASMREVLGRRYQRLKKEGGQLPGLIVVDGGKGQLSSAVKVLREMDLSDQIPVIGLAKKLEEVFIPEWSESLMIPKTSSSLKLLQRIRDEAHRFAVTFHREQRSKKTFLSELEHIPGIGRKTAEKLIRKFGSVSGILDQDPQVLQETAGKKVAGIIQNHFNTSLVDKNNA